jgi:hypothetical protein
MSGHLQTVHVRVTDASSGQPTPCRVRFTGLDGTYHAPFGRPSVFPPGNGDGGGNLCLAGPAAPSGDRSGPIYYAYIDGACEIRLPAGVVHVEVARGPEYRPIDQDLNLKPGQLALRLTLERWCDARQQHWYSGDTHVAHLTPHAALLEGAGEDVAVVNLLAGAVPLAADEEVDLADSIAFHNVVAFSGQRPALERPGHLVAVNTFNCHAALGSLILLNCHRVVYPLYFPSDDAIDEWALVDWCDQCHRKGGLVLAWRGAFNRSWETLADLVLGKVDGLCLVEGAASDSEDPFVSLRLWHVLLQAGFRVPLTGGSWRRNNTTAVGERRTYARLLPGEEQTYPRWIEAVRAGRTFVTNGPLLFLQANGADPGATLDLADASQRIRVRVKAESLRPLDRLEVVANGKVVARAGPSGRAPSVAELETDVTLPEGGWLAARCLGPFDPLWRDVVGAQTSPVYVTVRGRARRPDLTALADLDQQLAQTLDWVLGEARAREERHRDRLAGIIQAARTELARRVAAAP